MRKIIFVMLILTACLHSTAQTLYTTQLDSIPFIDDSLTLKVGTIRGNIQWQSSTDGKNWMDITGKTGAELKIPSDKEASYRAKIMDGDCFETYSDTAVVLIPRDQNKTIDPKTILGVTLLNSDGKTFTYKDEGEFPIKQGNIFVDENTVSAIRIVSDVEKKGGDSIIVHTTQGTMADLFVKYISN